uniref:Uncharacterized protein n=1 Tax=Euplotes harpa TaxID=151035 RepID=A0A7S3JAN8_9SPIT|mmetsp:Transcript_24845/g.28538  ORF Transcript_24845/g.28538 Transcript_24845/m.28538 type:complete len:165 (+) Transcript_24845:390-884(+)
MARACTKTATSRITAKSNSDSIISGSKEKPKELDEESERILNRTIRKRGNNFHSTYMQFPNYKFESKSHSMVENPLNMTCFSMQSSSNNLLFPNVNSSQQDNADQQIHVPALRFQPELPLAEHHTDSITSKNSRNSHQLENHCLPEIHQEGEDPDSNKEALKQK